MNEQPTSNRWAEFFNEGFFGYGEKGDFTYFSFWHFLPIILLITAIILTYIYRDKIKNSKHEKTFRLLLGLSMIIIEMSYYWRLLYIGNSDLGERTLLSRLPFQICIGANIIAILMILTLNKHMFDIDVFICLTCGILPLILPAVISRTGPAYYRYYQFWGEHIIPIYCVFYMMFVKDYKYDIKNVYKPIIYLLVLGSICIYANYKIPTGTFMYLQGNDLGDAITSMLPNNQFGRYFIFMGVFLLLFGIEFLIFYFVRKYKNKKSNDNELIGEDDKVN